MSARILLALDGSAMDPAAFREARRVSGGAEIHLLHVVPSRAVPVGVPLMGMADVLPARPVAVGSTGADAHLRGILSSDDPGEAYADDDTRIIDRAVRYLEGYRRLLRGIRGLDLVRTGAPADAILEVALTFNIDLIVMSTHARPAIARWFTGSVSETVLRRSQLPVLLARRGGPVRPEGCRRILVPLDGSPASRGILSVAKPLAVRLNAEILLLELVDPKLARPGLEDVGRELTQAGTAWRAWEARGDPAEQILRHAASTGADLIAMSAATGRASPLFGRSVPQAVLSRADGAVLLRSIPAGGVRPGRPSAEGHDGSTGA